MRICWPQFLAFCLLISLMGCGMETAENAATEDMAAEDAALKDAASVNGTADPAALKSWDRLDTPVEAKVVLDWTEGKDHVGEVIGVEGRIVDTYNSGRACFLNFTTDWKGEFYIAILGSNLGAFPEAPEKYFMNHKVRVVGKVAIYKGRPQIVVETAEHIRILDN